MINAGKLLVCLFLMSALSLSAQESTDQAFYDYTVRNGYRRVVEGQMIDGGLQQRFQAGKRNDVVWGAEYRTTTSRADGPGLRIVRDSNVSSVASAIIQDEIK